MEQVSWDDVQRFLSRLNAAIPEGGLWLPTEAEWEYACKAGTATAFWFGKQITPEQVNYDGSYPYAGGETGMYRETTVPVYALPCNSWGLYQIYGNVWEWCQDWYGNYGRETVIDPSGPARGAVRVRPGGRSVARVLRGGSWFNRGGVARSARRDAIDPRGRLGNVGFRLAQGQAVAGVNPEGQTASRAGRASQPQRSGSGQARPARRQRKST